MTKKIEIERKYLLSALPEGIVSKQGCPIRQGYVVARVGIFEIRLRQKGGDEFSVCSKTGGLPSRDEKEAMISQEAFSILWPATGGRSIEKVRHTLVGPGGFSWEVDEFSKNLKGLVIAEVELPDEHTEAIIPESIQEVLVREVTRDVLYTDAWLAMMQAHKREQRRGRRKP